MVSINDFSNDKTGSRFKGVINDAFKEAVTFLNNAKVMQRLLDAEIHHDRPPLAGVIRELENLPKFRAFFEKTQNSQTKARFKQGIGVLIRMHMESVGWEKSGRQGSLGRNGGLSLFFTRAERYQPKPKTSQTGQIQE